MKRIFAVCLALLLSVVGLIFCGSRAEKPENLYADASTGHRMTFRRVA